MTNDELQVENGNFTRIINPLMEQLLKVPFKGCELAVAFYIIRKTYGFNKTQDEISLSQFQKDLERSRQTIVTSLKNLQLVEVARLVKRGNMKGDSNIWAINKYYKTWKLVNMARLVKRNKKASLTERLNLVKTARHTKDTKNNTKDTAFASVEYLKAIPIEDMAEITKKYSVTKDFVASKAEDLLLYCESKGVRYKNYRSFLINAVKKDSKEIINLNKNDEFSTY